MARAILAVLFFYLVTISAEETASLVEGTSPSEEIPYHLVAQGDTLWDISARYLQNPLLWPSLWELNKPEIANPNRIYPNQKVYIRQKPAPVETDRLPQPAALQNEPEPTPVTLITEPETSVAAPVPAYTPPPPPPNSTLVEIGKVVTLNKKAESAGRVKSAPKILMEIGDEMIISLKRSNKVAPGTIFSIFRQREDILDAEGDLRTTNGSTLIETVGAAELTEKIGPTRGIARIIAANTAIEAGDSVRIWQKTE